MNDKQLEKKFEHDITDIHRDLNALMENGVTNVTKGFEKFKSGTKETLLVAAESVKKEVGYGLDQYNSKAQELAEKVPGNFMD